jgi:hypothetical protein
MTTVALLFFASSENLSILHAVPSDQFASSLNYGIVVLIDIDYPHKNLSEFYQLFEILSYHLDPLSYPSPMLFLRKDHLQQQELLQIVFLLDLNNKKSILIIFFWNRVPG